MDNTQQENYHTPVDPETQRAIIVGFLRRAAELSGRALFGHNQAEPFKLGIQAALNEHGLSSAEVFRLPR